MNIKTITKSVIALLLFAFAVPAISDPPDESGPNVTRFEDTFAVFNVDTKSGLTSALGFNPLEACDFNFDFDTVSIKDVNVPSASLRIVSQFSGYVQASVWPIMIPADMDFPEWCLLFAASSPLATGMADVNNTDNDVVIRSYASKNENAYGWNAHGTLYDGSGVGKVFHLTYRTHWSGDGDDPDAALFEVTKIKLK